MIAIATWVVYAVSGTAMSVLTVASFAAFGILGFWTDSMDTLIITGVAVVLSVLIGIPLAILMAHSKTARSIITPVLDVMQTLPTFTYLLPMMLLFGIGAAAATMCTLIYALPPVMRIASHGIREVSPTTLEATASLGQTSWQRLLKVELPMAKRTIIVGINQTTMAALSMVTIAAFINGPGLGQPVVQALAALDVGDAFVPGLCIVIMAIMARPGDDGRQRVRREAGPAQRPERGASTPDRAVRRSVRGRRGHLPVPPLHVGGAVPHRGQRR